jgi:hypothetical protein
MIPLESDAKLGLLQWDSITAEITSYKDEFELSRNKRK